MEMPIPALPAETSLYLVCWPAGYEWAAILRGLVTAPARGRFWDGKTGNIIEVQEYVRSNVTMGACDELILVLQQIRDGINSIDSTQIDIRIANQASAEANQKSSISLVNLVRATASSASWANSFSQSWAEAYVQLAVEIEAPIVSPTLPPPTKFITPSGISATAAATTSNALCNRVVYIVDSLIDLVDIYRLNYAENNSLSLAVFQGLASGLLEAIASLKGGHPIPIAAATLAGLAAEMVTLLTEFEATAIDEFYDWLVAQRQDFICELWRAAQAEEDTLEIQRGLNAILIGSTPPILPGYSIVKLWYNRTTLALLYYDAVGPMTFPAADVGDCEACDA
jgi:hypothetical protein